MTRLSVPCEVCSRIKYTPVAAGPPSALSPFQVDCRMPPGRPGASLKVATRRPSTSNTSRVATSPAATE